MGSRAAIGGVGFHERARVASAPVIEVVEAGEKVQELGELPAGYTEDQQGKIACVEGKVHDRANCQG